MSSLGSAVHVPRASLTRLSDHLDARGARPRWRGSDHISACCPAHDDQRPSLEIDWKPDPGRSLVCCQQGCATDDVLAALGLTLADLYDEPLQRGERPARPKKAAKTDKVKKPQAPKEPRCEHAFRRTGTVYTYTDELGEVLFEVVRQECSKDDCKAKNFPVRCPDPTKPDAWLYRWPDAAASRPLYRLPEVLEAVRDGRIVYLVEGEKDADAVVAAGEVATCNPGGAASVNRPTKWRDEHTKALVGAHVVLVADRDAAGYRHARAVSDALSGSVASLRIVEAVDGKDAHDHLAAGHALGALAPAVLPDEPLADDAEVIDLDSRRPAGPADSGNGKGGGGKGSGGTGSGGGAGGGREKPQLVADEFAVVDGTLAKLKRGRSSRPVYSQVLDAEVRVARVYVTDTGGTDPADKQLPGAVVKKDDRPKAGKNLTRGYDLTATKDGRTVLLERVTRDEWVKLEWVARLPFDVQYADTQQGRSDVRNAILAVSTPEQVAAYAITGWRRALDGRWIYVHAGGAIDANGPVDAVEARLPEALAGFALPTPPETPEALQEAIRASLTLLERLPTRIAAPLLGAAYRAVLGGAHRPVMLVGGKGTGKSSLTALAGHHFAPGITHETLPIPLSEDAISIPALTKLLHWGGDCLLPLDDAAPDRSLDRAQARLNALARLIFNGTGRHLSNTDGTARDVLPPRGIALMSGEFGPSAGSAEDRTHYVPLVAGEIALRTLISLASTDLAVGRAALTAAMAQHYAAQMPMRDWLRDKVAEFTEAFADPDAADEGQDLRRSAAVADFAVGWHCMLDMAVTRGALTRTEADDLWERAWQGLQESKQRQGQVAARRSTVERFADLLLSAFMDRGHLLSADGPGAPAQATSVGWKVERQISSGIGEEDRELLRPRGMAIGWTDGKKVWLDPGNAYAVIEAQARAESDPLNLGKRSLAGALADANVIRTEDTKDGRRTEVRAPVGTKRVRVWELDLLWLFTHGAPPDDSGPDTSSTPSAPTAPAATPPAPEPAHVDVPAQRPAPAPPRPAPAPPRPADAPPILPTVTADTPPPAAPAHEKEQLQVMARANAQMHTLTTDRFRAPAVVVDSSGGWLADNSLTCMPLPERLDSLADAIRYGQSLHLGMAHEFGMPDDAQVWLMPDVAARLGLPANKPEGSAATRHPAVQQLRDAGWNVTELRSWMSCYRKGERTVRLVVVGWEAAEAREILDTAAGPVDAPTLAGRLALYAQHTGIAYRLTPGVTGLDLVGTFPHPRTGPLISDPTPPKPALSRTTEDDYDWVRPLTADERGMRYLHSYDARGMYLGAFGQVNVGLGDPVEGDNVRFDKKLAGYWLYEPGEWGNRLLPDPFHPIARRKNDGGPRWYWTATLAQAVEMGYELPPMRALVYRDSTRFYAPWANALRDGRELLMDAAATGDPDAKAVLDMLKATYRETSGMLTVKTSGKLYRPDHRHAVIAQARASLTRKIVRVGDTEQRFPIAVATDCVLYASDDPNPVTACPAGLRLGDGLGQFGHYGTALTEEIAPQLPDPGKVGPTVKAGAILEAVAAAHKARTEA